MSTFAKPQGEPVQDECGDVCPDGPYAGCTCSLLRSDPHSNGEHEAHGRPGEVLETWPVVIAAVAT